MDHKILSSRLLKTTQELVFSHMTDIHDSSDLQTFAEVGRKLTKKFLSDSSLLPSDEGTRLLRMAVRSSIATGARKWVNELVVDDPVVKSHQLSFLPAHEAESILQKQKELLQSFDPIRDPEGHAAYFDIVGNLITVSGALGHMDSVRQLLSDVRSIYSTEKSSDLLLPYTWTRLLDGVSWWERERGDIERAKKLSDEALKLAKTLKSESLLAFIYNSSGALHAQKGQVESAIEAYQNAKEIREKIGDERGALICANNISSGLISLGRFEEAIKILKDTRLRIEHLYQSQGVLPVQPTVINVNLASACQLAGKLDEALTYAKEAYDYETTEDSKTIFTGMAQAVLSDILIDHGDSNEAQRILEELKETIQNVKSSQNAIGYYYGLGRLELQRRNVGQAHEAFLQAHQHAFTSGSFAALLRIQLRLAELYIQEYRMTDQIQFLNKAHNFIENVIQATREQEFTFLLCHGLMVRANIEAIQDQFDSALKTLEGALNLAQVYPKEQKEILDNIELIKTKSAKSISPQERKQSFLTRLRSHLVKSFKFSFNQRPSQINYKIYGVILLNDSGIPFYSNFLDKPLAKDTLLISGLISAINSFSTQLFGETASGALKSIRHENLDLLLEAKDDILIALITDRDTFELRNKLLQFLYQLPILKVSDIKEDDITLKKELEAKFRQIFSV
ncbi:MAG: tetratricopeptide repeat protein [Candidatus Hodarchaeota archaeon]